MNKEEVVWEGIVQSTLARIIKDESGYCAQLFKGDSVNGKYEQASSALEEDCEIYKIAFLDTRNKSAIALEKVSKELSDTKTELYGTKDCLEESSDKVQTLIKEKSDLRDRVFKLENEKK
jgi:hypothetical protein